MELIPVYRINISKTQFSQMKEDERLTLLLLGHVFNQMGVQFKMLSFSMNNDAENEIEQSVSAAQTHILLRLFLGTLFEAWEAINTRVVKQSIWGKYVKVISEPGAQALSTLQKIFDQSNLLAQARNNIAYHFPNDKVLKRAFDETSEAEPWEWYLSHQITNSFYFSSDVVVSHSFITMTGEVDVNVAFKKVMAEVASVTNGLNDFMMALMNAIVQSNFPEALVDPQMAIEVSGAPNRHEFFIPFYAEEGARKPTKESTGGLG